MIQNLKGRTRAWLFTSVFASAIASATAEAQWTKVYEEDFSTNPGWTTGDPESIGWDQATGTYQATMTNGVPGQYAFIDVPLEGEAFKLEYDFRINSCDGSAGLTFGVFDPDLLYSDKSVTLDPGFVDCGEVMSLVADPDGNKEVYETHCPDAWEAGVWYRVVMEYEPDELFVSAKVSRVDNGELEHTFAIALPVPFPDSMSRIGMSRIHMQGQQNGAAVDGNIDNIVLSVKTQCRADFNGDGVLDIFDFLAFFNEFAAGCP